VRALQSRERELDLSDKKGRELEMSSRPFARVASYGFVDELLFGLSLNER
jgi:hypothetical protein